MAKDTETERGKDSILPPAPKKPFLDGAPNQLSRTIAQIRTGHWLFAPYLKRTRKNRDDKVSDRCWWCGQWRMSRTHVFLQCIHPDLGSTRKEIWERPDEDGRIPRRPTSIWQLLGKAKWEIPLADWIVATGVELLGPRKKYCEEEGVKRNEMWRREPFAWDEIGYVSYQRRGLGFAFTLILFLLCSLFLRLLLSRCLFPYQWGLIPQMGKTHRWGKRNVFSVYLFLIRNLQFCYVFVFVFCFCLHSHHG
jgi:hypothetical protein